MYPFVLPRLDWGASQKPGAIEKKLASGVLARWVSRHADSGTNPVSPTPVNLMMALKEYEEHCTACHGADGSGWDRFEADFYPPVPNLTRTTQKLSDSELYFIIANGIRNTAMPAFGKNHSPSDIWRIILWVRHVERLTTQEKLDIARELLRDRELHDEVQERGEETPLSVR